MSDYWKLACFGHLWKHIQIHSDEIHDNELLENTDEEDQYVDVLTGVDLGTDIWLDSRVMNTLSSLDTIFTTAWSMMQARCVYTVT